jgi:hypothetical protein
MFEASTWEAEVEESQVQGQPGLYTAKACLREKQKARERTLLVSGSKSQSLKPTQPKVRPIHLILT